MLTPKPCRGDDAAVKDTVVTMIEGDVRGKLFVDCSTIHPDTTDMVAKSIEARFAQFVACPGSFLSVGASVILPLRHLSSVWRAIHG